jgi:catechol 2,3-dioxygenase-like lactoylglutathione lyase family enzyme
MIDHVTLRVRDLAAAKAFFAAVLRPLGYAVGKEFPGVIGLGVGGLLDFWLFEDAEARPQHLAFSAPNRAAVDAFHAAALGAGGSDNGPPGLRLDYHPSYYAAFVFDPSGHNVEAVCHRAPGAVKKIAKGPKGVAQKIAKGPKGAARKIAKGPKGAVQRIAKGPKGVQALARRSKVKRIAKGPKGNS